MVSEYLAAALAWLASITVTDVAYGSLVLPFILGGVGMGMYYAPVSFVVLQSVRPEEEGQASGAVSAVREVGGVFGIAVLAAVFSQAGSYGTGQSFVDGLVPATWVGAGVVAAGAGAAFLIRRQRAVEPAPSAAEVLETA